MEPRSPADRRQGTLLVVFTTGPVTPQVGSPAQQFLVRLAHNQCPWLLPWRLGVDRHAVDNWRISFLARLPAPPAA